MKIGKLKKTVDLVCAANWWHTIDKGTIVEYEEVGYLLIDVYYKGAIFLGCRSVIVVELPTGELTKALYL